MLIFVLGTVGNALVVLVTSNRLKTMTDVYLLNLAVADLLFLATLPFWAVNAWQGWAFGRHAVGLCKAVVVVYKLNIFSSMLLLACISVDRYVAIVQVARAHNLRRERRMLYSRVACLAVWLLSSLLAVPEMLFAKVPVRGGAGESWLQPGACRAALLKQLHSRFQSCRLALRPAVSEDSLPLAAHTKHYGLR